MINRKTADAYIAYLQKNAREINQAPYAYSIQRMEVFGSYLTDKAQIGDLDVMVTLAPRGTGDTEHHQIRQERIARAYGQGRVFQNATAQVSWPTEEVHRHLRGGKRGISIHDAFERAYLLAEYRVIFDVQDGNEPA